MKEEEIVIILNAFSIVFAVIAIVFSINNIKK